MKKELVPLFGVAFIVATIATGVFYGIATTGNHGRPSGPQVSLVVAAKDMTRGTLIANSDVKLVNWSGTELPKWAFRSPEEVAGRMVTVDVAAEEPLTALRLASPDSPEGAAAAVQRGTRAVSVQLASVGGVARMLRPGDRVDVQVIYSAPSAGEPNAALRTLLQNIEIIHIDLGADPGARSTPPVVTLMASPEEADMLALADAAARVRLVLRHPADDTKTARQRINFNSLVQGSLPGGTARPGAQAGAAPGGLARNLAVH